MADFDPDKYLAETAAPADAFDPDAYLAQALPAPEIEVPQLSSREPESVVRRTLRTAREALSPLIGPTENQRLAREQKVLALERDLPQLAAAAPIRPNLVEEEGFIPAAFTPSESAPLLIPRMTGDAGGVRAVGRGVVNAATGAINSMTSSPGGLMTLGAGGLVAPAIRAGRLTPAATRAVVATEGAFSADQARQLLEGAGSGMRATRELAAGEGDTEANAELLAGQAINALTLGLAGGDAVRRVRRPRVELDASPARAPELDSPPTSPTIEPEALPTIALDETPAAPVAPTAVEAMRAEVVNNLGPAAKDVVNKYPLLLAVEGLEDGRHIPVEIRHADGTTSGALMNGYGDAMASSYGGPRGEFVTKPSIGYYVPEAGGFSHTPIRAGDEIISPIPTAEQWQAGVRDVSAAAQPMAAAPEPSIGQQPETIAGAAFQRPNGEVLTGSSHFDILNRMPPELEAQIMAETPNDGFVTNTGRFVSRDEAAALVAASDPDVVLRPDGGLSSESMGQPVPQIAAPQVGPLALANEPLALDAPSQPSMALEGSGTPPPPDAPAVAAAASGSNFPRNTTVPRTLKEAGLDSIGLELKTKLYDYTAPEETLARNFEMEYGYEVPPSQKLSYLNSRVINSRSIADAYLESSGYKSLIRDVPDLKAFDQHLIDLHSLDIAKNEGITQGKTIDGIDVEQAQARVDANREAMAPYVDRLRPFADELLNISVQKGLISPETAQVLIQMYPNYVPMEKVFDAAEQAGAHMNTGNRTAVASLSKQSVIRRRDGTTSTREIKSPTASFLNKVDALFLQGAKNEAAKALADSRNLPGWSGILQEVANDNNAPHTFTYLDNGFKRTVAAPKEIVEAVKALNRQQLGLLGRVIGFPMRVFKLGVTGADPVFAARNTARDQATGFIASSNPAAFAANFPRAVAEAVGHGEIYQRLLSEGGVNTSFTLTRDNPQASVDQIRAGRSVKDKALYTITNPAEFIRTVEDTIGRSEQATRIQTYMTEYDAALKQGFTPKDASARAAEAARQQLSDFSRHGDYGPIMRAFQPYLTAAFAGNRALLRNFRRAPARTTAITAATLGVPVLAATAWALIDPRRKEAWDDLAEYEKDNNLIFVPDNPVKGDDGRWNVIKIPLPQGYSKMARAMRRSYEAWQGGDPTSFAEMAQTGLGMVLPIEPTAQGIASNVLAQPVKPIAEIMLNKNSFTGRDIIPDSLMRYDPERQYDKRTSGTAIQIGKALNVSPLYVEHAIKGYTGTLGSYALNAADRLQSTVNPDIQIGGRSVSDQAERGFASAQGGEVARRFYTLNKEASRARATYKALLEEGADAEAEAYYKENEALIDMARFLEKTARRNGIDPDLKGDALAERLRERDERMKEALRRVEERQAEAVAPVKKQ